MAFPFGPPGASYAAPAVPPSLLGVRRRLRLPLTVAALASVLLGCQSTAADALSDRSARVASLELAHYGIPAQVAGTAERRSVRVPTSFLPLAHQVLLHTLPAAPERATADLWPIAAPAPSRVEQARAAAHDLEGIPGVLRASVRVPEDRAHWLAVVHVGVAWEASWEPVMRRMLAAHGPREVAVELVIVEPPPVTELEPRSAAIEAGVDPDSLWRWALTGVGMLALAQAGVLAWSLRRPGSSGAGNPSSVQGNGASMATTPNAGGGAA
jgi:hypothetical protein